MVEENVFTDVEQTLKAALEARVKLDGQSVPLRVVTPDPDYVELELPCLTLQLTDVRRDPSRLVNERRVEKDHVETADRHPWILTGLQPNSKSVLLFFWQSPGGLGVAPSP